MYGQRRKRDNDERGTMINEGKDNEEKRDTDKRGPMTKDGQRRKIDNDERGIMTKIKNKKRCTMIKDEQRQKLDSDEISRGNNDETWLLTNELAMAKDGNVEP